MHHIPTDIHLLIFKRLTGRLSESEAAGLRSWVEADPRRAKLLDMITDPQELHREYRLRGLTDTESAHKEMLSRIAMATAPARRRRNIITAAASIALLVIAGMWLYTGREQLATPAPPLATAPAGAADIRPGTTRALLHSSAGKSITLGANDSTADVQSYITQLQMSGTSTRPEELCLEVPRGGEFKIILEDSTTVWLNSESTLRYPQSFSAYERRVEVTGEAYFAVHKDPSRPFYVVTAGHQIRVYGTTFNIRDYADDENSYTTLESGSIALTKHDRQSGEIHLSPGHQAIFRKEDASLTMTTVNPEVITGWRHGRFVFEGQTLRNIMRDLARWYNFTFEFTDPTIEGTVFNGSIPRYADFKTAITILENCGDITFSITGNNVTVSPMI